MQTVCRSVCWGYRDFPGNRPLNNPQAIPFGARTTGRLAFALWLSRRSIAVASHDNDGKLARLDQLIVDFKGAAPELRRRSTLAAGDVSVAHDASERAWQCLSVAPPQVAVAQHAFNAIALAEGDLVLARCLADEAVSVATGWQRAAGLLPTSRTCTPNWGSAPVCSWFGRRPKMPECGGQIRMLPCSL
jgi:hypothetical protein